MILSAFSEKQNNDAFEKDGYTLFPLLSEDEVDFVLGVYQEANKQANRLQEPQFYGVNYSLGTLSMDENTRLMKPVLELLQKKLFQYFSNFELLGCVFITKPPNTQTTFDYHQDWSYTDEEKFAFATCWIPLCNTDRTNGGLTLIKGSHRFFKTYRSESLPSARIPFENVPDEVRTDVSQSKGSCLAFHQAVFHGSYPNLSNRNRPVLAVIVKPTQAPVVHYIKNGNGLQGFEMSKEAFDVMLSQIPRSVIPAEARLIKELDQLPALPAAQDLVGQWRATSPLQSLFQNEEQNRNFTKNGFAVLSGLVSADAIEELRKLYAANFVTANGMFVTHHSVTDEAENKRISASIFDLLLPFLSKAFKDYKSLISHFAVKSKGSEGRFNLHQDWSIIEEQKYAVAHCWVPLQDVGIENGTLAVLPASHLLFHNYRSGTCPIRFTPLGSYEKQLVHFSAKAGDVVVYHPSLFHGSGINNTSQERLAVVAAITHVEASPVYFHKDGDKVGRFELTERELFSRLDYLAKGGFPEGKYLEDVPYRVLEISEGELEKKLSSIF